MTGWALLLAACYSNPAPQLPRAVTAVEVARAWPVMGTMLVIRAYGADSTVLLRAISAARDSVRLADSLMSSYRSTSDVAVINRSAARGPVHVSAQTMAVLRQAKLYWRLSDGAFDPTVAPLLRAWGFLGGPPRRPDRRELDSLRSLVDYGAVELDMIEGTVRLPRQGMEIDLGGIAKGKALDMARGAFVGIAVSGGSIDLGGNILFFGRHPTRAAWPVAIVDPVNPKRQVALLQIDSGAVATSGDYEHTLLIDGTRYSHILDPRTGFPSTATASATAIGPSGVWSDGLSATLFLIGADRAVALADSLPNVGAIIVSARSASRLRASRWARERSYGVVGARLDRERMSARSR